MITKEDWLNILKKMWQKCWFDNYLLEIDEGEAFAYLVKDPSQQDQIVSEGMSYGLLLCTALAKIYPEDAAEYEKVFYGLLRGLKYFGTRILPYWKIELKNNRYVVPVDQKATASDADIVIPWTLYEADTLIKNGLWQGDPQFDLQEQAAEMLTEIIKTEIKNIPYQWGYRLFLKPSREWGGTKSVNETILNPSYLWLDAFKCYIKKDPQNKKIWKKLYSDSSWLLKKIVQQKESFFDWAKVKLWPFGKVSFSDLGQGMSFQETFDGIRTYFILGAAQSSRLCKKLLNIYKNKEFHLNSISSAKEVSLAALLSLAYGAKSKKDISRISEKLVSGYYKQAGYFGDSIERYYNNTLIMIMIAKNILRTK